MKEHEKDPRRRETLAVVIAEIGSNSIALNVAEPRKDERKERDLSTITETM
jgi:hypothetical protein